jgi:hypothetical protein
MRSRDYRPTADDFRPIDTQKLSLSEAGEFDKKFYTGKDILPNGNVVVERRIATGWEMVCRDRARRGVSRRLRIAGKGIR